MGTGRRKGRQIRNRRQMELVGRYKMRKLRENKSEGR
jgi:hypothetical protein